MEEQKTIFNYIQEIFSIFSISTLLLIGIAYTVGEEAKDYSSMFRLGSQGLTSATMLQFLLMSALIAGLRYFFFSEKILKKKSVFFRTAIMLISVIFLTAVFAACFDWFPIFQWQPWLGFTISFGVSFGLATLLVVIKTRMENKRMQEGLATLKRKMSEREMDE